MLATFFPIVSKAENKEEEKQVYISYEYKEDTNTVLATITSSVELKPTKVSWKLSEDKKQYTFEFNSNTKYTTTVTDINGRKTQIQIEITRNKRNKHKSRI